MMTESQQLLGEYASRASESAFRQLVGRYLDFVYSTAVRHTGGNTYLAEDIAQTVFVDLARMAERLPKDVMLGGWLHRHTCFVAAKTLRGEARRLNREKQAAEMISQPDHDEANLAQIAPILDEAINELEPKDRDAISLRFFESRNLRAVGEALGAGENAAQKRVARAIEELRRLLARKGVVVSSLALTSALAGTVIVAAPSTLANQVSGTALAAAAGGFSLLKLFATAKLKLAVAGIALAATAAAPYLAQRETVARLRTENDYLRQRLQPRPPVLANIPRDAGAPGEFQAGILPPDNRAGELAQLHGEIDDLRRANDSLLATLNTPSNPVPNPSSTFAPAQFAVVPVSTPVVPSGNDIIGKVSLAGTPPDEILIEPLMDDRYCGKARPGRVTTRHYVVLPEGGLANVFVFVKSGPENQPFPPPAAPPVLDQNGCLFEPYVFGLMAKQPFAIRNSDGAIHNVHASGSQPGNQFNFAQPRKGGIDWKSFPSPELPIKIRCDLRPWMFAHAGVFDHPFFAVTDTDGNYRIANLPAGQYTLEALHLKAGRLTRKIQVRPKMAAVDFTLSAPSR